MSVGVGDGDGGWGQSRDCGGAMRTVSSSPKTMATTTMTMTRLAVLATEAVTGPVFLMVIVASSL